MNRYLSASLVLVCLIGCAPKERHGINTAFMDISVDPAKEFYNFANGGWLKKNEIPASEGSWGTFSELADRNKHNLHTLLTELAASHHEAGTNAQKVGDFFFTGMDSATIELQGLTPVKPYLDEIDAITTVADVLKNSVQQQRRGGGPLFSLEVLADFKESAVNAAYAGQGGLGLPDRDYYLDKSAKFETYRKEYLKHLQTMNALLGADAQKAEAEANTIMKIETRLAKASRTLVQMRDLASLYNKRTPAEANKETPTIDWNQYFAMVGKPDIKYFVLAQPEFFKEVGSMLKEISIEDWKTYLRWHLIHAAAPSMSSKFAGPDFAFYRGILRGVKEMKPRWKRVTEQSDIVLGEALGQLYAERYFPTEAKTKANQMVNDLRAAFKVRIQKLNWMSDKTKAKALEKLEKMGQKIGYPDKWRDYSALEIKRDAYVLNVIRANEFEFNRNVNKIGKPVDKTEWGMTPPSVNAYSNPFGNEIVFPAGILQPPFFDPKADDASNYGGIGAVIGHEISHEFDDQGNKFDADGNMVNWWTEDDKKKFDAKAQVVVDQFDAYTVLDSVHVNGKLTLGENIADLAGTAVAYDALQLALARSGNPGKIEGYTPEQRFYIAWANVWGRKTRDDALLNQVKTNEHSPANYRVIGPLSNTQHFFDAFGVKPGDSMRRPDSLIARIW
jgi:putative endopeptidase